jgi:hypothetical protein
LRRLSHGKLKKSILGYQDSAVIWQKKKMLQAPQTLENSNINELTTLELAQALANRLAISEKDWHRLKSNRQARAGEQASAALVFLIKEQPNEAIPRLQQAVGWLDRSITAPPCPTHGHQTVDPAQKEASQLSAN